MSASAAASLVRLLMPTYARERLAKFPFPSKERGLDGPYRIGQTIDRRLPYGLWDAHIAQHISILGSCGSGKSTVIKHLIVAMHEAGKHVVVFDRKRDYSVIARQRGVEFTRSTMRLSLLAGPTTKSPLEDYLNNHCNMFAQQNQFLTRGVSVYRLGVFGLCEQYGALDGWSTWDWTRPFPTWPDLLDHLKSNAFLRSIHGRGRESAHSIIEKMESRLIDLEEIVSWQRGVDLQTLWNERMLVSFDLEPLAVESQNLLILTILLQYYELLRVDGTRDGTPAIVFVLDEGKGLLRG